MTDIQQLNMFKVLAEFDFEKVYRMMLGCEWKWGGDKTSPYPEELKECARDLIEKAFNENLSYIASGGFHVEVEGDDINLFFGVAVDSSEIS